MLFKEKEPKMFWYKKNSAVGKDIGSLYLNSMRNMRVVACCHVNIVQRLLRYLGNQLSKQITLYYVFIFFLVILNIIIL